MRVELKGVHTVRRRLADGSARAYHYAWRGGPRIDAPPGSAAFVEAYRAAHRERRRPAEATLKGLIEAYKDSADFKDRSESSKRAYRAYLKLIEDEFGDMDLEAAQDRRARGDFKAWRDTFSATPRKADYAWTTLVRVLSFGVDRGRLSVNVCARGGRLYKANRKDKIWTDEHIDRFIAVASPELQLALVLALWTGQRQGDLLRIAWTHFDGRAIRFRQGKTDARVAIPAGATLKDILAEAPKRALTILTNQAGEPWTSDGFRASWGKACDKAGIKDVTFHDLRGSAIVRLALAGCEVPEIAAITGHSLADVTTILDAHYLGRDIRLAEAAMRKRERKEGRTRLVKRGVKRSDRSEPNNQPSD